MLRDADVTRRMLSGSRRHGWHKLWMFLIPLFVTGALVCVIVLLVHLTSSDDPVHNDTGSHLASAEEYDGHDTESIVAVMVCSATVGCLLGFLMYSFVADLRPRMAYTVSATLVCVTLIGIPLAVLLSGGGSISTHQAGLAFLGLLAFGVPFAIGAMSGAGVAAAS